MNHIIINSDIKLGDTVDIIQVHIKSFKNKKCLVVCGAGHCTINNEFLSTPTDYLNITGKENAIHKETLI